MPTADIGFVILLLIHLGSVIVWLGSSIVMNFVIGPTLGTFALDEGVVLSSMLPRFARLVSLSSISTVIAGLILFGYVGSIETTLLPSGLGLLLLLSSAVLGLVAFIAANIIILPSSKKLLLAINAGGVPKNNGNEARPEDAIKFVESIKGGSRGVLVLLIIVFILMVSGTYL